MKLVGIVASLCASIAIAFGVLTAARAGTLPDIGGTWYANGNPGARCSIRQSGNSVSLTNEVGINANGTFTDPSTLDTRWGVFGGGRVTGRISADLRRITWSNGTYWTRPTPSPFSPTSTPAPTPRPTPSPEPLRVSVHVRNNDYSPVYVYAASLTNGYGFTYAQCVSFRNVSTKVLNHVEFAFVVTDRGGSVEAEYGWTDKGTFTPPVNIDDHCFSGRLWAPHVVRRMTNESIRVTQATFEDGTVWNPSMQFKRGYASSGQRLAEPVAQSPKSGDASDESVATADPVSLLGLTLENGPSGVYVKFVAPGSACDAAGLRPGDRIVSIGSNKVKSVSDVRTILRMTPEGAAIPMSLDRDGHRLSVSVKQ